MIYIIQAARLLEADAEMTFAALREKMRMTE
jgi:hypothetical protein